MEKERGLHGDQIFLKALPHIHEPYDFKIRVPKHDPEWKGPWDCAELVSWVLYQLTGSYYGCRLLKSGKLDAFTGSFQEYAEKYGYIISVKDAVWITGALLLRKPINKKWGHIGISDGMGGVLEASYGPGRVVYRRLNYNHKWDYGILIPEFTYSSTIMNDDKSDNSIPITT